MKLKAVDGKRRATDVANTEQLLRIIQSIPSKKAEPFKLWLAQVGRERIEETLDPELIAHAGGSVAGNTRRDPEKRLGRPVITSANAAQLNHVVTQMIKASVATADEENAEK